MKRFYNFFISSKATIILLLVLSIAIAAATFIEDKYDTITAQKLVYDTKWLEFIFILLTLNLIGHIKKYNLLSLKKIGSLIFHLAFIVMIIGAGITRYFGFEGNMHIRKGNSSNIIYSSAPYIIVSHSDNKNSFNFDIPITEITDTNSINLNFPTEKGDVVVKFNEYINNAVVKIEENVKGGKNIIELSVVTASGLQTINIEDGEEKNISKISIAYNNDLNKKSVKIFEKEGKLSIVSPYNVIETDMEETQFDTIKKDSIAFFKENYVYNINDLIFLYVKFYKSAQKKLVSATTKGRGVDAIVLDVTIKNKTYKANVFNNSSYAAEFEEFSFDGTNIIFGFGNKPYELPFSIYLKNFIFEKYPGSESPSSYKSEVKLIDKRSNINEDYSIYMNNVLDYNKYRFFQSSYDSDEQGTILSVNHDFWGTLVSYLGYTLLTLGFIITLFNKNSRFLSLRKLITDVRSKRKSVVLTIAFLLGFNVFGFSQNPENKIIDASHAEKFGHLLIQTYDGRFAPVHTLAIDLMHKISKKDNFNIEGKGKMNAMQAFIDMMVEPEFWQKQNIIYVPVQEIRDIIGIKTKYASFFDFYDSKMQYKLEKNISDAFQKKQSQKNKVDREILKVDERLNIFHMLITRSILKIFPEQGSSNNKWLSWDEKASTIPLTGAISIINEDIASIYFRSN